MNRAPARLPAFFGGGRIGGLPGGAFAGFSPPMFFNTDDLRIRAKRPLASPAVVIDELRLSETATEFITASRSRVASALRREDDTVSWHEMDSGLAGIRTKQMLFETCRDGRE